MPDCLPRGELTHRARDAAPQVGSDKSRPAARRFTRAGTANRRIAEHVSCLTKLEESLRRACRRFRRRARPIFIYCLFTVHPRINSAGAHPLVDFIGHALMMKDYH